MEYFLEHIAKSIYDEFGENIGEHCIVFPGRRAGLFFHKYLALHLSRPVWAPAIMTINDLFSLYSGLRPAENEILLFELYRVYRSLRENAETFDEFYYWGDMLLNDFDDTDKYLADASALFRNVSDLRKIDQEFGGLTEEQVRIIRSFWTNFNPVNLTGEKKQFLGMWSVLSDIYSGFRNSLREKNLAYEGMIFRDVIENTSWKNNNQAKWKMFHFIGFNALNECEKALMDGLKAEGKARFYWDYDNTYLEPGKINSAGYFIKENLARFGNDMPAGWKYDTMLSAKPENVNRDVIETSSDVAQVKLMPDIVMNLNGISTSNAHETAVILCDENLLMPVLTSLPSGMPEVNITMGYPLRQTPVYSLVKNILELQRTREVANGISWYSHLDVLRILKNFLVAGLPGSESKTLVKKINDDNLTVVPGKLFAGVPVIEKIFSPVNSAELLPGYLKDILTMIAAGTSAEKQEKGSESLPLNVRNEFIYRVVLSINRLENVSGSSDIKFTIDTWSRLLDRLLRSQSVPFSGEPLSGIQVMGILETRALDFRNLVILSVNEGLMPSITTSSSFIPFSLRQAFGLPSINHQESIYAYHFFRLLHRAENVTFIYNSNSEGMRSGEMSRFLQQMKYDRSMTPDFRNLGFSISNPSAIGTLVERNDEHKKRLLTRFSSGVKKKLFSPSAINTWLCCRMKFYYRYVNDIREPEKITGEIDQAMLGTLLHEAMREVYSGFRGKVVNVSDIRHFSGTEHLESLISGAIHRLFRSNDISKEAVNEKIVKNVLHEYIKRIMETDLERAPFTIIDIEKPLSFKISVGDGRDETAILAGGYADRIDRKDGIVSVIDYKTGKVSGSIGNIEDLFLNDRSRELDGWLQTMIYCEGYLAEAPDGKVRPSVYRLRNLSGDDNSDYLEIRNQGILLEDYQRVREEFLSNFRILLTAVFSGSDPFIMTKNARTTCQWCPYRILCRR
jgi:hypothetical protein